MPKSTDTAEAVQPRPGLLTRLWDGVTARSRTLRDRRRQNWLAEAAETLYSELGEASGVALARRILDRYAALPPEGKLEFLQVLATRFAADPQRLDAAIRAYFADPHPAMIRQVHEASDARRPELLRRLNFAPSGTASLLRMREDVLDHLPDHPELGEVDADFEHLFYSWFNRGFLQLRPIDWHTPAVVLEKIIRYEAVHEISGWEELRRRLAPADRRCFAFFHPRMPGEPLIFVEVALVEDMPEAIAPLLDRAPEPVLSPAARTAVFYSISNCQPGLRGVSLGNFLIKKVAEELGAELPQLRTFCTLSPVPGLARWLTTAAGQELDAAARPALARVLEWRQATGEPRADDLDAAPESLRQDLSALCARYLVAHSHGGNADPVARFHLDNGARLERVNWAADRSRKGLKQSLGLMVNYLYEVGQLEKRHQLFVDGEVSHATDVRRLMRARD